MTPKIGDIIYIPSGDSHWGGKAIVSCVYKSVSAGNRVTFVEVEQCNTSFNWDEYLSKNQDKLKNSYSGWAYSENPNYIYQYSFLELQEEIQRREHLEEEQKRRKTNDI